MTVVVFCGPTLGDHDRRRFPNVNFLPPVQQGQFYRVACDRPRAIGIIDGYFDGVAAVWHKEILWALKEGVAVFGAASMGALRAAELHPFGMIGIGRIFEDFRDGRLTDDDEVALVHGPAELGYPALSESMVNIRATAGRARSEGILDAAAAELVVSTAKALFYQRRNWPSLIEVIEEAGADVKRFGAWLGENKIDQKRDDALLMLTAMEEFVSSGRRAPAPGFVFEWTEAWAGAPWLGRSDEAGKELSGEEDAILDELRLQEGSYRRVRREALLLMLSEAHAARAGLRVSSREIRRAATAFRLRRGMSRQADLVRWSEANAVDEAGLQRLMAGEATLDGLAASLDGALRKEMLDCLRLEDSYVGLRDRALQKRAVRRPRAYPDGGLSARMLAEWYFHERLGTDVPGDLGAYVEGLGLENLDVFYSLIASERSFLGKQRKAAGRL